MRMTQWGQISLSFLLGSLTRLILLNPLFNLPFAVLLMKSYFDQISDELREAALVDGPGEVRAFVSVILSLVRPGLAAVGVYTAIMAWNDFLLGPTMNSGGRHVTADRRHRLAGAAV